MPTDAPPGAKTDADAVAWNEQDLAGNPHTQTDKARRVERMFAAIADSYDLNNRVHSLGRDQAWRRITVRQADVQPTDVVLDVACGTGDLSLAFARANAKQVIGIDFTVDMLKVAERKQSANGQRIQYAAGDAMQLPLPDASVDIVSIAFGIRNVSDPQRAMREFHRVLRPGGRLMILEFGLPTNPMMRSAYNFYFQHILPRTATLIAGDRSGAYRYLPRSVNTFFTRGQMIESMQNAGFDQVQARTLTFGIALCYRGMRT